MNKLNLVLAMSLGFATSAMAQTGVSVSRPAPVTAAPVRGAVPAVKSENRGAEVKTSAQGQVAREVKALQNVAIKKSNAAPITQASKPSALDTKNSLNPPTIKDPAIKDPSASQSANVEIFNQVASRTGADLALFNQAKAQDMIPSDPEFAKCLNETGEKAWDARQVTNLSKTYARAKILNGARSARGLTASARNLIVQNAYSQVMGASADAAKEVTEKCPL